jgi:hypothetical protein
LKRLQRRAASCGAEHLRQTAISIDAFEIDRASEEAQQLVALVEGKAGPRLARVTTLLDRILLLRSAWAPGLRFVGAQASVRGEALDRYSMSFGGCALSVENAFVACLGEAAERLSQVERTGDVRFTAPLSGLDHVPDELALFARQVLAFSGRTDAESCDWLEALDLARVTEVVRSCPPWMFSPCDCTRCRARRLKKQTRASLFTSNTPYSSQSNASMMAGETQSEASAMFGPLRSECGVVEKVLVRSAASAIMLPSGLALP